MHEHLQDSDLRTCTFNTTSEAYVLVNLRTLLALATVIYDWFSALEDGKEVCAVFFDYQRHLTLYLTYH